jgi:hypothetical protein
MDEMREVAGAVGELTGPALARAVAADEIRRRNTTAAAPPPADAAVRLEGLLARGGSA